MSATCILAEPFREKLLHRARTVFEMQIKTVRRLGDFAQPRFIEL